MKTQKSKDPPYLKPLLLLKAYTIKHTPKNWNVKFEKIVEEDGDNWYKWTVYSYHFTHKKDFRINEIQLQQMNKETIEAMVLQFVKETKGE